MRLLIFLGHFFQPFHQIDHNSQLLKPTIDTVCLKNVKQYSCDAFKLLTYCQIVLDETTNERLNKLIGNGKLMDSANYDRKNLLFNYSNDNVVSFEILYMLSKANRFIPDIIQLKNDTLFLHINYSTKPVYKFSTDFHKLQFRIKLNWEVKNLRVIELKGKIKAEWYKNEKGKVIHRTQL